MAGGDAGVAMDAADLGDDVDLVHQIKTAAGSKDLPARGGGRQLHAQAGEDVGDGLVVQAQAQEAADALAAQAMALAGGQLVRDNGLDDGAGLATADGQQQGGGPFQGPDLELGVHAALEAVGGVGVQAIAAGLAADVGRGEEGALEQDVASRGADRGARAAHDPGQGHGLVGIGDDQGVRRQFHRLAVE